jgi:hypothetical protein
MSQKQDVHVLVCEQRQRMQLDNLFYPGKYIEYYPGVKWFKRFLPILLLMALIG